MLKFCHLTLAFVLLNLWFNINCKSINNNNDDEGLSNILNDKDLEDLGIVEDYNNQNNKNEDYDLAELNRYLIQKKDALKKLLKKLSSLNENTIEGNDNQNFKFRPNKRGLHMQVYYEPKFLKDGTVLLVPKDRNKHYFIGKK